MHRRVFLASITGAAFAKNWDQPAYPNWSREFVDKMLTDSPWAHPLTAPFILPNAAPFQSSFSQIGLPGGIGLPRIPGVGLPRGSDRRFPIPTGRGDGRTSTGVKTEAYLIIRWSSALPIRQALAIEERTGEVAPPSKDYLIHIAGIPTVLASESTAPIEKKLLKTATLSIRGRRSLHATNVEIPEHGTHLMATLHFPRFEDLTTTDGIIEIQAEAGPIKIQHQFKLKPMVYHGNLEL